MTNSDSNTVSVIDTATNTINNTNTPIPVGIKPYGVAVTPDGKNGYVTNSNDNTLSVINTSTYVPTTISGLGLNDSIDYAQFIGKLAPTITWNNPTNITYGTALSGNQLDATASVPENIIYIPPSGTVLSVCQNQQLNTTFTPTDTANYTTAIASVFINVVPAVPALEITKKASPITYDDVEQIITYTYTVKNVGNVDIKGPITVTDEKFGTITIPNSDTLSKGSSVTKTDTYKITQADIDRHSVTNLAYATVHFNGSTITSPKALEIVLYERHEHHQEHPNDERDFGPNYIGAGVPGQMISGGPMYSGPMNGNSMYGSPMYSNEPYGYGSEPSGTVETPNSNSNGYKAKAPLSKHKHHTTKHHKAKKIAKYKLDKK